MLDLFAQMACGFRVLHDAKIMHKNIDSTHFMIKSTPSGKNVLKIIGFSELREMAHENSVSNATEKNHYVPPEILLEGGYTRASDIWGLGMMLHEMARAGEEAFKYTDTADMTKHVEEKKHLVGADGKPKFSKDFETLLDSMLKIAPEDRSTIANIIEMLTKMGKEDHIGKWVDSEDFKAEWHASRKNIQLINNDWKFFKAAMSDD